MKGKGVNLKSKTSDGLSVSPAGVLPRDSQILEKILKISFVKDLNPRENLEEKILQGFKSLRKSKDLSGDLSPAGKRVGGCGGSRPGVACRHRHCRV